MSDKWKADSYRRVFLLIIAIIATVTVIYGVVAGREWTEILGYGSFVIAITYMFFS